jgi:hypothetical protein
VTPVPAVRASLFTNEDRPWLEALEAIGPPPRGLPLPDLSEAREILSRLDVADDDATEILASWPSRDRDPELWWFLERAYHLLVADLGGFEYLGWPDLPRAFGDPARFFWVYVFLAALEDVRRFHETRGVPENVSTATFRDLGRNLARDRRLFGEGGLRTHGWLTLHFRGAIYELGRLQFNRMRLEGDAALGVHIPEGGPLAPDACDESFARAREFFARHFPDTPTRIAVCTSWLLDQQLAEYLDEDANIMRFQRRFRIIGGYESDADILRFVFGRIAPTSLDDLPQRTTLERAIVAHLRAGRHWQSRTGVLEL